MEGACGGRVRGAHLSLYGSCLRLAAGDEHDNMGHGRVVEEGTRFYNWLIFKCRKKWGCLG